MSKPQISIRRPTRLQGEATSPPLPIARASMPTVDPESPQALAYAMQGRSAGVSIPDADALVPAAEEPAANLKTMPMQPGPVDCQRSLTIPAAKSSAINHIQAESDAALSEDDLRLLSIKIPNEISRKLTAVVERRGSKRTHVALEALAGPLRQLALEHRAGRYPELPKIVSGTARASIAFSLPPDLSADLNYVLKIRRAVTAQVVTRLLVPAIEAIWATEFPKNSD